MADSCFSVKGDCDTPAAPDGNVDGVPWDMSEKGVQAHDDGVKSAERSMFWDAVGIIPGGSMVGAAVSSIEGEVSAMTGDKAGAAQHYADASTDAAMSMVPGSSIAALMADTDAYNQRKDGAMPDQAPTMSEQLQKGMWDHFAQ